MPKILLVGSGVTSAISSHLIKRMLPSLDITIWDKANGTGKLKIITFRNLWFVFFIVSGGRMSTSRCNDTSTTVDLGVQYITVTQEYKKSHSK